MGTRTIKRPKPTLAPYNITGMDVSQVAALCGINEPLLTAWLEERDKHHEEVMIKRAHEICYDFLRRFENFAGLQTLLAAMFAIRSAWRIRGQMSRFLDHYEMALDYVDQIGFKAAYDEITKECGIDLEFADFEIEEEIQRLFEEVEGK